MTNPRTLGPKPQMPLQRNPGTQTAAGGAESWMKVCPSCQPRRLVHGRGGYPQSCSRGLPTLVLCCAAAVPRQSLDPKLLREGCSPPGPLSWGCCQQDLALKQLVDVRPPGGR